MGHTAKFHDECDDLVATAAQLHAEWVGVDVIEDADIAVSMLPRADYSAEGVALTQRVLALYAGKLTAAEKARLDAVARFIHDCAIPEFGVYEPIEERLDRRHAGERSFWETIQFE